MKKVDEVLDNHENNSSHSKKKKSKEDSNAKLKIFKKPNDQGNTLVLCFIIKELLAHIIRIILKDILISRYIVIERIVG